MPRAVDLDQLPNAIPTMPRLMHRRHPLPPILPQPGRHHPLPDRLAGKINPVQLHELLARKRRPEVRIALADDANNLHPQCRRIGPVARLPAAARHQCSSAVPTKYLGQPKHLATAKTQQSCRLRNPDPLLCQIAQNVHPIDLRTAHQNHRHRPPAPHPIRKPGRVTSLSGSTVTSLSGVYNRHSPNEIYGMSAGAVHSPLILDALMIGPHSSMSDFSSAASSVGVEGVTDVAMSASRCFSCGYAS